MASEGGGPGFLCVSGQETEGRALAPLPLCANSSCVKRFIVAHLQTLWPFKCWLCPCWDRLYLPLWFTVQQFSPSRGSVRWGRGVPLRLLLAPKHFRSRFSAALIDARSVSSFWCVSDTATNKGPRCSPPPQFTATPPPR